MNSSSDWVETASEPRRHRFGALAAILASEALPWPAWTTLALVAGFLIGGGISAALTQRKGNAPRVVLARREGTRVGNRAAHVTTDTPAAARPPSSKALADTAAAARLLEAAARRRGASKKALAPGAHQQYEVIIREARRDADVARRLRLDPHQQKALLDYLEAQLHAFERYREAVAMRQSDAAKAKRLLGEAETSAAAVRPLRDRATRLLQ